MRIILVFFLLISVSMPLSKGLDTESLSRKKRWIISDFPVPRPMGTADKITLPIKRSGNLILIELKADTLVGNFILDTGAPHLVLNKTYFRSYPSYGGVFASGITGSVESGDQIRINKLDFGGIHFNNVDADMISLSHIEDKKGVKILGLLGLNLFENLELMVDINEGSLTLYRLNKKWEAIEMEKERLAQPKKRLDFENELGLLLLSAEINGKKARFYLDTGAELCVLHTGVSKKIFESVTVTSNKTMIGAGGKKIDVLFGTINKMDLDGFNIEKLPITIANLNGLSSVYGTKIEGMLGFDFLAKGKMLINLHNKTLTIW
jgi:predicted aspartyl protease